MKYQPEVKLVDLVASWVGLITPRMALRRCFERFDREFELYVVSLDNAPVDCLLLGPGASLKDIWERRYGADIRVSFRQEQGLLDGYKVFRFRHEDTESPDHVGRNVKYFDVSTDEIFGELLGVGTDLVYPFYFSLTSWATQDLGVQVEFRGIVEID